VNNCILHLGGRQSAEFNTFKVLCQVFINIWLVQFTSHAVMHNSVLSVEYEKKNQLETWMLRNLLKSVRNYIAGIESMNKELLPATNVDFLFRYESCFQKSKHMQRYTLHVRVATIHQRREIVCSEFTVCIGIFRTHLG